MASVAARRDPIRILSPHCGLDAETTSGGAVYERELLRRVARKHNVRLLMTRRACDRAPSALWTVRRLPVSRGLRWWLAPFLFSGQMREEPRPDVLRVHSLKYIGPSALYARRTLWPGVRLIAHHHHIDRGWHPIERVVSNRMDRVIVGSQFALTQMRQRGWRTDHVRVVPYGVDAERFRPASKHDDGQTHVLYFGGLKPRKNLGRLLGVWQTLAESHPEARLTIAGGGPLLDHYRSLVASRCIPRVDFTGYVPEYLKPIFYDRADVFVFPSTLEGFGLPVLEAMASGLPCLTSDAADFKAWLGLWARPLVTARDAQDWTEALDSLLLLPDFRRCIGQRNRLQAEAMTWERCVDETVRVYKEAV